MIGQGKEVYEYEQKKGSLLAANFKLSVSQIHPNWGGDFWAMTWKGWVNYPCPGEWRWQCWNGPGRGLELGAHPWDPWGFSPSIWPCCATWRWVTGFQDWSQGDGQAGQPIWALHKTCLWFPPLGSRHCIEDPASMEGCPMSSSVHSTKSSWLFYLARRRVEASWAVLARARGTLNGGPGSPSSYSRPHRFCSPSN